MCIAIVKPKGIELPDKNLLKRCWKNNPDGAGLMYNTPQGVVIHKGFMTFNGFYKFLQAMNFKHDLVNSDLVLHFRIATSGGISRETTHPFPVCDNYEDMKQLDCVCEKGFVHNGIISYMGNKEVSDTMEYNKYVINNIHNLEDSEPLLNSLARLETSRFCVLTKDKFLLGGDWTKDNDLYFSNTSYKETPLYKFKFNGLSDCEWEMCECCQDYFQPHELTETGYGKLCDDCFDYFFNRQSLK